MNEEKELLIRRCKTNPVLKILLVTICAPARPFGTLTLPLPRLCELTGLNERRVKIGVEWLLRKGFLKTESDGPFPQRSARYELDCDLAEAFTEVEASKFGVVGKQILAPHRVRKDRVACDHISFDRGGFLGDDYGTPLPLSQVIKLRDAALQHVANVEDLTEERFERHRQSDFNLVFWSQGHIEDPSNSPPASVCDCAACKREYEAILTAWTNKRDYGKQEQKLLRMAIDELA